VKNTGHKKSHETVPLNRNREETLIFIYVDLSRVPMQQKCLTLEKSIYQLCLSIYLRKVQIFIL